jgi:hypothetical protein
MIDATHLKAHRTAASLLTTGLIVDLGYDSVPFRQALAARGIAPLHPIEPAAGKRPFAYEALPPALQNRESPRPAQGLAPDRKPL